MNKETLKWLGEQWNLTIVNEAGQTRVGVAASTPAGVRYRWTSGANLEAAILVQIGLDKGLQPVVR